jgi:RimJ/RimL family protein N-acetyltransferase
MPLLEGEKVRLRAVEQEDLKEIFGWQNDPESSGEYESPEPEDWLAFEERMKQQAQARVSGSDKSAYFIIEVRATDARKSDRRRIGRISYRFPIRVSDSLVEISYRIAKPDERGKGYASEAVKLLVEFLFVTRSVNRIQVHVIVDNSASVRVLEKNGFQREGIMREMLFGRGSFQDHYLYAILRRDWKKS